MTAFPSLRTFLRPALSALLMLGSLAVGATDAAPEASEGEAMAAVPAPLLDTYWKLVQLGDGPHVSVYDNQPEPHLVLETGSGRFHGAGGCNRLRGSYGLDGRWLRFSVVGGTRMACVQGMRREQLLVATLAQVSSYAVQGQKLVLSDAEGRVLLRLEAVYLR
ncbi:MULTISPECIES: META domain-containing protein [Comamonas]|uniref:META domain-containing protein n=1 Tax=Comamonas TaxID=283 RepID=UPI0015F9939B|nr:MULTISPECIES: META domain-containing protein [Comamonas]UUC93562.1 META domain-containing protein [Comamonas sp. C11]WEE77555.1 META domain-containing protein [Comamonas testosteroni]